MSNENRKWLTEYEAFLQADEVAVPAELTAKVSSTMKHLLYPSAWTVFFKILGIHTAIGSLSLSVCHQFGMNPFETSFSLDSWFMSMWSHSVCMIACGVLFVGLSFLSTGYFLSIEEVRSLRRTEFIQTLALGIVSLTIFAAFGAELVITFAGLWLLGAVIGGSIATEAVWLLRRKAA